MRQSARTYQSVPDARLCRSVRGLAGRKKRNACQSLLVVYCLSVEEVEY